jgi:hypothetical protein
MAGIGGYNGWRWIFIVEGLITVVVAAVSKYLVVDWPHEAKFLTEEERDLVLRRLDEDQSEARMNHWDGKAARRILSDWKIYVGYVYHVFQI